MSRSILVPMYFWPSAHPESWNAVITAAAYVGMLVMNPNSGPGEIPVSEFSDVVQRCQAAHIKILGYVDSAYGERNISDVTDDINNYISWYQVDGFFIDDMYTQDTAEVTYYQQIHDIVKGISSDKQLVFNPGQPVMPEAYMSSADTFVSFEGSAQSYSSFVPAAYTNSYSASKFWHIVYGCDTAATINATLQQFDQQHAEWLYMTDLGLPNPYYDLPGNVTWEALLLYMANSSTSNSTSTSTNNSAMNGVGHAWGSLACSVAGAAALLLALLSV